MVEVRMNWSPVPLWLVADEAVAAQLLAEGVPRGRTWTVDELQALLSIPGITEAGARRLALAKLEVAGVHTDVRRHAPAESPPASSGWLPGLGGAREPDA
jgi:hypothetical protein